MPTASTVRRLRSAAQRIECRLPARPLHELLDASATERVRTSRAQFAITFDDGPTFDEWLRVWT